MRLYTHRKGATRKASSSFDPVPGVYAIVQISTQKTYVGASKNMQRRITEHVSKLRGGYHPCVLLQQAWNETGESDFEFCALEVLTSSEVLRDREYYWLGKVGKVFNAYIPLFVLFPPPPPSPSPDNP
jgi:hypothetical protein